MESGILNIPMEEVLNYVLKDISITDTGGIYFYIDKEITDRIGVGIEFIMIGLFFVAREAMCKKESASMYFTDAGNFYLVSVTDNAEEYPLKEAESGFFLKDEQIGVCALFKSMRDAIAFSKAAKQLMEDNDLSFLYSDKGQVAISMYVSCENQKLFNLLSEFSFDISQIIPPWPLTLRTPVAIDVLASL